MNTEDSTEFEDFTASEIDAMEYWDENFVIEGLEYGYSDTLVVTDEVQAEQFYEQRDDIYYNNPRLQEYQERCENSLKLCRPHFDINVEFLAFVREDNPSLNVTQSPKWWKRGNPAVFPDKDDIRIDEKEHRLRAYRRFMELVEEGAYDEIDQDDFFTNYNKDLAPRKGTLASATPCISYDYNLREWTVDSGASYHCVSMSDLSKEELLSL